MSRQKGFGDLATQIMLLSYSASRQNKMLPLFVSANMEMLNLIGVYMHHINIFTMHSMSIWADFTTEYENNGYLLWYSGRFPAVFVATEPGILNQNMIFSWT